MSQIDQEARRRRTFAIISHPDAGKTTLTEKLLWFGGAIQVAGEVRARKASRHATSDWMELEKQRGISVTSSVMQFPYRGRIVNLLDTPGHQDFSEDTYRTLTAVDSAVMVIDSVNGVESQTIKLLDVCRLRDTPILTFINKLDREGRSPIELLDEIESVLSIRCAPMTWPIGMGKRFRGVYSLATDTIALFTPGSDGADPPMIRGIDSPQAAAALGDQLEELKGDVDLVRAASNPFDLDDYLAGKLTPVFFGSAVNNFGVRMLLDAIAELAPAPLPRKAVVEGAGNGTNGRGANGDGSHGTGTESSADASGSTGAPPREVSPEEPGFSGFVFKIQANMDPKHRDRIAFVRVCSGRFERGMKLRQMGTGKVVAINNALTFMAQDRTTTDEAYAGDIIGVPNHGTIRLGETFTESEPLRFVGIPSFAPELFRVARLRNPLKSKQLAKGLQQLAEEGATQLFRPAHGNDLILGAVGTLQFDVVAHRLEHEYGVDAIFEPCAIQTARWISASDEDLKRLDATQGQHLGLDGAGDPVYLAPNAVNLRLTQERFPNVRFHATRELVREAIVEH